MKWVKVLAKRTVLTLEVALQSGQVQQVLYREQVPHLLSGDGYEPTLQVPNKILGRYVREVPQGTDRQCRVKVLNEESLLDLRGGFEQNPRFVDRLRERAQVRQDDDERDAKKSRLRRGGGEIEHLPSGAGRWDRNAMCLPREVVLSQVCLLERQSLCG